MIRDRVFDPYSPEFCYTNKINQILKPLIELFNINYFAYVKGYWDFTMFSLCNRPDFGKYFYEYKLYDKIDGFPDYLQYKYVFLEELDKNRNYYKHIYQPMKEIFDISHVVVMSEINLGSTEFFLFGAPESQTNFNRDFLLHVDYFNKFTLYFKDTAKQLIEHAKKERFRFEIPLDLLNKGILHPIKNRKILKESELKLNTKRFYLPGFFDDVYLTRREVDCLKFLSEKLTSKAIAKKMNISHYTVNDHINQIKEKFKCNSKKELLSIIDEYSLLDKLHLNSSQNDTDKDSVKFKLQYEKFIKNYFMKNRKTDYKYKS